MSQLCDIQIRVNGHQTFFLNEVIKRFLKGKKSHSLTHFAIHLLFLFFFFAANYHKIFGKAEEDHQTRKEKSHWNQRIPWWPNWVWAGFKILLQQWKNQNHSVKCVAPPLLLNLSWYDWYGIINKQSLAADRVVSWRNVLLVMEWHNC